MGRNELERSSVDCFKRSERREAVLRYVLSNEAFRQKISRNSKLFFARSLNVFEVLPKEKMVQNVELEFDNSGEADDAVTDDRLDA
jgi:hypothetical protein